MQVNFYNTGGWYYNSSWNTSVDAADHYYASKGRAWKMKITAVQKRRKSNRCNQTVGFFCIYVPELRSQAIFSPTSMHR